jgi:hypothetical protein
MFDHFARHFARGHPKPPNSTQQQPNYEKKQIIDKSSIYSR